MTQLFVLGGSPQFSPYLKSHAERLKTDAEEISSVNSAVVRALRCVMNESHRSYP